MTVAEEAVIVSAGGSWRFTKYILGRLELHGILGVACRTALVAVDLHCFASDCLC